MAGTFKEAIVKTDITQPSGLAIDYDEQKWVIRCQSFMQILKYVD